MHLIKSNKEASDLQEKSIAKMLDGKTQPNSGGGKFNGGDVLTKDFLIEAKTVTSPVKSFGIKLDWLIKADKQAFEQRKSYWALAFRFMPEDKDFFVIDSNLMKKLVKFLEENDV